MKTKLTILCLILTLLVTTGLSCGGGDPEAKKALATPVTLNIWGIFDTSDSFAQVAEAYKIAHPNVSIKYTKLRWEDYEDRLIEAWAEGGGPDIFVVHNTWLGKYQNKILPMPPSIRLPVSQISGFLKKQQTAIWQESSTLTSHQVKNLFPDVVYQDVVKDNLIYGLPFSVDTLALFYNRDHFDASGITQPPSTWQELTEIAKKLTRQNAEGEIIRSAVALGGGDNINRSNDILSLLMLQNGASMIDGRGRVLFNQAANYDKDFFPGEHAVRFYTDFALPSKEVYTWNKNLPEALELFSAGKLSMLFGFSYQLPLIRAQAPKIDLGIAPMLHINNDGTDSFNLPINWANYWVYTVFKRTRHANETWDFLNFMATKQYKDENGQPRYYVEDFLNQINRPPALRNLLASFASRNPDLAPFVGQILTATSWYRGQDPDHMNQVFKQMINDIIQGKTEVKTSVDSAATAISKTY